MSALVVLHEATRTGAPRVGGLIAAALQKFMDVRVLCLSDGPLVGWLQARIGAQNLEVIDFAKARHRTPFAERVDLARETLGAADSGLVYVNSTAASEFIVAAKACGRRAILHTHEKADMLRRLLEIDLAKLEILSLCDGVVLAASSLRSDLAEVFGFVPERCFDFGIAVDAAEIARLAAADGAPARNAAGEAIGGGGRLVVGMCGHASRRKGADIFFDAAAALPDQDFVWIGNWDRDEAPENPVAARYENEMLPNLYVTGGVDNPYRHLSRCDLFFLSSREDPNPLVLAEALLLGLPILAFSHTTAVADFLGRSAILCHGPTNTEDAVRVLKALDASEIRSPAFRGLSDRYRARFDITDKIDGLVGFLGAL